jgi:hypothetical protein
VWATANSDNFKSGVKNISAMAATRDAVVDD